MIVDEKESIVGRANLVLTIVAAVFAYKMLGPNTFIPAVGDSSTQAVPEWTLLLPLVGVLVVVGLMILSLFLIPTKPPV